MIYDVYNYKLHRKGMTYLHFISYKRLNLHFVSRIHKKPLIQTSHTYPLVHTPPRWGSDSKFRITARHERTTIRDQVERGRRERSRKGVVPRDAYTGCRLWASPAFRAERTAECRWSLGARSWPIPPDTLRTRTSLVRSASPRLALSQSRRMDSCRV